MYIARWQQVQVRLCALITSLCLFSLAYAGPKPCTVATTGFEKAQLSRSLRKERKMLRIGMSELPESLDPRAIWNYQHAMLLPAVFQTLVRLDQHGNIVGDLAEKWEIREGGKEFVFHLRKSAQFHNGRPVKASDVLFSLSRVFWGDDESSVAYLRDVFTGGVTFKTGTYLPSFKIDGENQVRIRLPSAYAPLLYVLSMAEFSIYSETAFKESKYIGSGPLIPMQFEPSRIVLTKNCLYSADDLKLTEIDVVKINDSKDAAEKLKKQEIDTAIGIYDSSLDSLGDSSYTVTRLSSIAVRHLYLNSKSTTLADPKVRASLKTVIQEIASHEDVRFSFELPLHTFMPKGVLPPSYYRKDEVSSALADAKKYLSGVSKGQPMRILLRRGSNHQAFADELNKQLTALGYKANASLRTPEEIKSAIASGNFEMSRSDYFGMYPDVDGLLEAISSIKHVSSQSLLAELSIARPIAIPEERLEKYRTILQNWESTVPAIPLYQINLPIMHTKDVVIPATEYRFASDLWRIFWPNK